MTALLPLFVCTCQGAAEAVWVREPSVVGKGYWEGDIVAGKKEGLWQLVMPGKGVVEETTYRAGKREGYTISWHAPGKLYYIGRMKGDKGNGPFIQWYMDGRLKHVGQFLDGMPAGLWKAYRYDSADHPRITTWTHER